ncbi:hypothetical protein WH47_08753 [Habropoda laboriosa]|uniref:Uncharacterized protein n=1 Tax=Habropoda laboriosa TaxID=597456 RepID=A0A0L7R6I5_9HYME|nr:PREDICTED: uncharacterized protein LOC108571388 [Habropoda laboriosa]KOC66361.1 hypothetical protein WH47_08753 [Habropoda laboriosa]
MTTSRSLGSTRYFFVYVLLIGVLALFVGANASAADEVPAFFLKIAKNIPRVGRSDGYDDFLKSRKNIGKIGGLDADGQSESWPSYGNDQPFSRLIKRRVDYPALDDAWSWQHFPLAIEGPRELWRTLAGYTKDTTDDIDNEIWERKKRTGNEQALAVAEEN